MPSFLRDLRRRSRSSFRTEKPLPSEGVTPNGSSSGSAPTLNGLANGRNIPHKKSNSTLNSNLGSFSPPSTDSAPSIKTTNGTNGTAPPSRPPTTNRYSLNGSLSPLSNGNVKAAASPFSPRVTSVSDNSWVNQKVLLVYGHIGDPSLKPLDGTLTVWHHQESFPPTNWPVYDSQFKVLIHLQPGPNRIRLDFTSPKLSSGSAVPAHATHVHINYLPLNGSPPLHLAIILAKDSPGTYDAVPERVEQEGNGLPTAIRKFRMAAYLWQAFTGEQMNRNHLGRRCFRYEEEWQQGTLTYHDQATGQMRNEARIHVIKCDKTVEELRDLDLAQQYDKGTKRGELFVIASKAVKDYFKARPGQRLYVSAMFLDSHWDPEVKVIRGHAALGGGDETLKLAIFGSHALQSYPASIEEVVPAFTDTTPTDTKHVANDSNESGTNWEAANIGIGAHLHETGHLFGCPHQESGIMLRDYTRFNRTFCVKEAASKRTGSQGKRICLPAEECSWHRLDCLRFRYHPCFRQANDPPASFIGQDESVTAWAVDNNNVLVTAPSGVAFTEIYTEGDELCRAWIEYADSNGMGLPSRQVTLTESDLRARLPEAKNKRLRLEIHSAGGGKHTIEDFGLLASKASRLRLPDGRAGFRGSKLGFSKLQGSTPEELILDCATIQTKLLTAIKVYHGIAVDGIEFVYEDSTSQLFGKKGGKPGGSEFLLDTRKGEILMGFYVRAGLWIDGLQVLTSLGRRSEVFGKAGGGSGHTLIPPRGYRIAGLSGSCGAWMDGLALIITR
ncbi:zinc metallo protein-like proteinase [Lineolata rhizophorae]|uniref:Zinc metallo protein-like proteinase n=1 Tax=Lineolata rhizophorae TaxID=578093 RepID=A0A6A6P6F7_9PEZI|nr:zinc metallo protein-like proteinase [Lineolata rhizophorae]